ncbi:hypothetical protein [Micromonospora sp. URMC 103]|uniref:hypothetical protein n=1 Tax=Micromonospora sp. URMC 103 TaxID=3423406 RepID=UPI003F1BE13A
MGFERRWAAALALAGTTLLSGCGGPPPDKRSTEELLAIGQTRLDEIAVPAAWLSRGKEARRTHGKLRWTREYRVNLSPETAGHDLEDQIEAAGWRRDHRTCQAAKGMVCRSYARGGLTILLTASDGSPCPSGHSVCADVSMWMMQNFAEQI